MLQFDATFILVLVFFVIFMILMRNVYFEPVRKIKKAREEKIASDNENAQNFSAEYARLKSEYEANLAEARKKAQQVLMEIRQDAKKTSDARINQARTEGRTLIESQMAEISEWREEAYRNMERERAALAGIILEKLFPGMSASTPLASISEEG